MSVEEFFKLLGTIILSIVAILFSGFVTSFLWGWFMVPSFSLPPISTIQAIGIVLTLRMFVSNNSCRKDNTDSDDRWQKDMDATVASIFLSALVLGAGWILHLFM